MITDLVYTKKNLQDLVNKILINVSIDRFCFDKNKTPYVDEGVYSSDRDRYVVMYMLGSDPIQIQIYLF